MATSELISQIIDPTLIPNRDKSANWQPNGKWIKERMYVHDFYKSQERRCYLKFKTGLFKDEKWTE